jgi:hypothetical protein
MHVSLTALVVIAIVACLCAWANASLTPEGTLKKVFWVVIISLTVLAVMQACGLINWFSIGR